MATFGLDDKYVKKLVAELDVAHIRNDEASDFFLLPQLDAIYLHCGEKLKRLVAEKLRKSSYGPKPPIEMEIPKGARVSARTASIVGPSYFRPGSTLLPEDRVLYHFLAQELEQIVESGLDRSKVFSNKPLENCGEGFVSSSIQWRLLKESVENAVKSGKYKIVLKCDIAQYFFSINQHELVNQLEHQGLPAELVKLTEKFLSGLTLDRSSRGIIQGLYTSDLLGNGYLSAIDEFISDSGYLHLRFVDDMYIFFETADNFRSFFPRFVKKLRDYDLSLNERKTFAAAPFTLLREETELDKAILAAKAEAAEKLTGSEEVEYEGDYGDPLVAILETHPDEDEVELEATLEIFNSLDDFKGDERDRAEGFCLGIFRRAADPVAINYVTKRWLRNPDRARDYALYLDRFSGELKHARAIDNMIIASADGMIDYQWAWAAILMRRFPKISAELLSRATSIQRDGAQNDVVRSLLTYSVCAHGSPQRKKEVRDGYSSAPLLVQLAIIHCGKHFTSGERNSFMNTAESHGDIQALMCEAFKAEQKLLGGQAIT